MLTRQRAFPRNIANSQPTVAGTLIVSEPPEQGVGAGKAASMFFDAWQKTLATKNITIEGREQLTEAGLVAEPERPRPSFVQRVRRGWPDYQRCLAVAPMNHSGDHPDVSRADFTWAIIALDFGNSVEATAAELMRVSTKAKQNGEPYAHRTALRAYEALQDRVPTVSPKTR